MAPRSNEAGAPGRLATSWLPSASQTSATVSILPMLNRLLNRGHDCRFRRWYLQISERILDEAPEGGRGDNCPPGHFFGLVDLDQHRQPGVVNRSDTHEGGDVGVR